MNEFCPHCDTYLIQVDGNLCPNCHKPIRGSVADPAQAVASDRTIAKLALADAQQASTPSANPAEMDADDRSVLLDRIRRLERRLEYLEANRLRDGHTNLLSQSFFARAFAVWGHFVVAHLLIVLPLFALMFCASMMRGLRL